MRLFIIFSFVLLLITSVAYGQTELQPCSKPGLNIPEGVVTKLPPGSKFKYGYKPFPPLGAREAAEIFERAALDKIKGGGSVRLRGLGGFGYGQTVIDIIANWEKISLAAQKQYCYSWFGADSFENKYGYRPTWQRILNFGYITDEQLHDYLRKNLDDSLSKNNLTASDKKLRETYINCLNTLQAD